jgi:hypothetical protein
MFLNWILVRRVAPYKILFVFVACKRDSFLFMDVELILDFCSHTTSKVPSTESLFAKKLAYITSLHNSSLFLKSNSFSMDNSFYGVKSRASRNLKKVKLHLLPCEQSPLVFLLGTARRSERDSAELVYKFIWACAIRLLSSCLFPRRRLNK